MRTPRLGRAAARHQTRLCPLAQHRRPASPSRSASRLSVPLASGFGIRPITLDLSLSCIFGVPIRGIAIGQWLFGNIVLRDRKLMALTCFHDQQAPAASANFAYNRVIEVAVLNALDEQPLDQIESGPHWTGIVPRCA